MSYGRLLDRLDICVGQFSFLGLSQRIIDVRHITDGKIYLNPPYSVQRTGMVFEPSP
jgi:hypothetical protein